MSFEVCWDCQIPARSNTATRETRRLRSTLENMEDRAGDAVKASWKHSTASTTFEHANGTVI